ncbi:multisubunit sodium/proton antiporter, MrpD subunit [Paracoccus alcaliphilus]|uniref:Multisubunit sodium/proton antiporter, MrpD subunit n=1 Tax=Paracoccus alcaliphilus TaxID=34002 RepID=A0A1H8M4L2_9RHOB|nr:Na+/H+ antiporter subunit D [Paracoccus alcaliphilus]WCR18356.1 Na+/H+ antiporter subunit D [Paracoccus alcaliphilus]SEO12118.1 multisubunit sodium/proton antiporter, MrpD subunit [Paracoccus alcaliphilus]
MNWILALPILVPFVAAALAFFAKNRRGSGWISVIGAAISVVLAIRLLIAVMEHGVIATQMSAWIAPFGITLAADYLSAAMVLITAIISLAVAVWAMAEVGQISARMGWHGLFQTLIGGVTGAFLTGDIFNLYVWFEVLLISSFGLLVIGGQRRAIDGAVKYVTLNLISTVLFLGAAGLLYGATGTLNMADLRAAVAAHPDQGLMTVIAMMFMIGFGLKAGVFPLFFWLPASYHTPHYAVSAVFAGLLTKVGVYALMRVFTLIFVGDQGYTHEILLWVACLTMLTGVLGAAAQSDFRKILSFHIVSQIGYMVLGLALMTPLAVMGGVFYIIHHIIVKANLFLIAGISRRLTGSSDLYAIGGLYRSAPLMGILFLIPAFSLAGFPPLSGFWAKYVLVKASLDLGQWLAAGVALLTGLLTIFSMTKIWAEVFWKAHPEGYQPRLSQIPPRARLLLLSPVAALALMTVLIGLFPQPFVDFATIGAEQLLDPSDYVATVLEVAQ